MKVARFWAKGRTEAIRPSGKPMALVCWRWSEKDQEEAQLLADEAVRQIARRVASGEPMRGDYGYPDRLPREEIVEEIENTNGKVIATITRNSYGVLVLNTQSLMFIDVDLPYYLPMPKLFKAIARLFGKELEDAESRLQKTSIEKARAHSDYSFRIYRTCAGFRCAVVNKPIDPKSEESDRLLKAFGADPLYVRLCKNQECFRARLTPKPWRCDARKPPNRFPWEKDEDERAYRSWETHYQQKCRPFGTCRFLERVGWLSVSAEMKALIDLHDRLTRASEGLDLA